METLIKGVSGSYAVSPTAMGAAGCGAGYSCKCDAGYLCEGRCNGY